MLIVSNTSPLSNLILIGEIQLLQRIYGHILIPPTVHAELIRFPEIQSTISHLTKIGTIEIKTPRDSQLIQTLNQSLDLGESEAIVCKLSNTSLSKFIADIVPIF